MSRVEPLVCFHCLGPVERFGICQSEGCLDAELRWQRELTQAMKKNQKGRVIETIEDERLT